MARATMLRIEATSPWPRRVFEGANQWKQALGLLARFCSGASTTNPSRSARADQPAPRSYAAALWPQPWSSTTSGAPAGRFSGA